MTRHSRRRQDEELTALSALFLYGWWLVSFIKRTKAPVTIILVVLNVLFWVEPDLLYFFGQKKNLSAGSILLKTYLSWFSPPSGLNWFLLNALIPRQLVDKPQLCPSALVEGRHPLMWLLGHNFTHEDIMHLGYDMVSLLLKGRLLEVSMGSTSFMIMIAALTVLHPALHLFLSYALNALGISNAWDSCVSGVAGLLFGMTSVLHYSSVFWNQPVSPPFDTFLRKTTIDVRYLAWAELLIFALNSPRVSFVGCLSGLLAGITYPHCVFFSRAVYNLLLHYGLEAYAKSTKALYRLRDTLVGSWIVRALHSITLKAKAACRRKLRAVRREIRDNMHLFFTICRVVCRTSYGLACQAIHEVRENISLSILLHRNALSDRAKKMYTNKILAACVPRTHDQVSGAAPLREGQEVLYEQTRGRWIVARVKMVDRAVTPHSYIIVAEGIERNTVASRLRRLFSEGDEVLYHDDRGEWRFAEVECVDRTDIEYSYVIRIFRPDAIVTKDTTASRLAHVENLDDSDDEDPDFVPTDDE